MRWKMLREECEKDGLQRRIYTCNTVENEGEAHLDEVQGLRLHLRYERLEPPGGPGGEGLPHDGGVLGPVSLRGSAQHPEYLAQLVNLVLAGEQRPPEVLTNERKE